MTKEYVINHAVLVAMKNLRMPNKAPKVWVDIRPTVGMVTFQFWETFEGGKKPDACVVANIRNGPDSWETMEFAIRYAQRRIEDWEAQNGED